MALYSVLNLKSSHDPADLNLHIIDSKDCRFGWPIAWIALFNKEDIDADNMTITSPTSKAIDTITSRSESLSSVLGSEWDDGLANFVGWLGQQNAQFVELNLGEWYSDSDLFNEHFTAIFEAYNSPPYQGKHLLTRKPKISKAWEQYILSTSEGNENGPFG